MAPFSGIADVLAGLVLLCLLQLLWKEALGPQGEKTVELDEDHLFPVV